MDSLMASTEWRRSRRCEGGNCLEVAQTDTEIVVRDSKRPSGPLLRFSRPAWTQFVRGVRDGDFDLPR